MAQVGGISLRRMAILAIALGTLLLLFNSTAYGQDDRPLPWRGGFHAPGQPANGGALLIDDCEPIVDLLAPWLAHIRRPPPHPGPARTIPALWAEHRGPKEPLRGTGNEWLYMPFNGCGGEATGDMDLRNPSGEEAVRGIGARFIAIDFEIGLRRGAGCRCPAPPAARTPPFRLLMR